MKHVKEGVTTLLCIVFKPDHFAVVKVHLKDQRVSVWDSAIDPKELQCAEILWLEHIVYLHCVHFPDKVRYGKDKMPNNIQTATGSKQRNWKNVWKIQAHKTWHQPNGYICGAIAINRFAFKLQPCKCNEEVDTELLQLIMSLDTLKDDNSPRAANLFEYLLKN